MKKAGNATWSRGSLKTRNKISKASSHSAKTLFTQCKNTLHTVQKPFHTVQKTHSHFISAHLSELSACDYSPTQRENHPKRAFYTSHLEKLIYRGRIKLKSYSWHSLGSKFSNCIQFPFEKAAFWPKCAVSSVTFCNRAFSLI